MKQILIASILIVVLFLQLCKAEQNASLQSEDLSDILSAELEQDLERLRNKKALESNEEHLQKQKRGRQCLWKVCSWHLEKEKIKNALLKNRIPEIRSKINSDRMIALLNMNRF